jgi:hypothetical protein
MRVVGLLPDGAREPALRLADGRTVPLKTADNVYEAVIPLESKADLPVKVTWTAVTGEPKEALVPESADALGAQCHTDR